MRRLIGLVCTAVLAAAACVAVTAVPAAAAAQCTYVPKPPARLAVNRNKRTLTVRLAVRGGSNCTYNMNASTYISHGKDDYYFSWFNTKPRSATVYGGAIVPGRYRTNRTSCYAYTPASRRLSCSVAPASVLIKYAARAGLAVSRAGARVRFTARASHFVAYRGFRPVEHKVAIQRLDGGRWRTIHVQTAPLSGYRWSYRHRAAAKYRALSWGTVRDFAATSRGVRK